MIENGNCETEIAKMHDTTADDPPPDTSMAADLTPASESACPASSSSLVGDLSWSASIRDGRGAAGVESSAKAQNMEDERGRNILL